MSNSGVVYATVESLTGGNVAALFTSQEKSSEYYAGGVIVYHESVKQQLGVKDTSDCADPKLALNLAKNSLISADVVIATAGCIDTAYSYCILVTDDDYVSEKVILTAEQLAMNITERQQDISQHVLKQVVLKTRDPRLIQPAGILVSAEMEQLKQQIFTVLMDSEAIASYKKSVEVLTKIDKLMALIPDLLVQYPNCIKPIKFFCKNNKSATFIAFATKCNSIAEIVSLLTNQDSDSAR